MRGLWCVLLVGCGRIDFEQLVDASAPDASCAPAAEVCDGIDNNCNSAVDEGCPCTPFNVTLSNSGGAAEAIVWNGARYITLARDATNVNVIAVEVDGSMGASQILAPRSMSNPVGDVFAWNGSTMIAAYTVNGAGLIATFDAGLQPIAAPVSYTMLTPTFPVATFWDRDHFVVAYTANTGSSQAYLRELAPDGTPQGPEMAIAGLSSFTDIQLMSTGYVAVVMNPTPSFVFIGRDGTVRGTVPITTVPADAFVRGSAVHGDVMALLWAEIHAVSAARYQLFDSTGAARTSVQTLVTSTSDAEGELAAASDGFWLLGNSGQPVQLVLEEIDLSGTVLHAQSTLDTISSSAYGNPTIGAADHRELVVFPSQSPAGLHVIAQCL